MYLCIVYAKRNHKTIVIIKTRKREKYKSENKKNDNYCTAALLPFTKKKGSIQEFDFYRSVGMETIAYSSPI